MTTAVSPTAPTGTARLAGWMYLYIIFAGLFAEVGVRSQMVDYADAAATASNILAAEALYRAGFVAELFMTVADITIACLFYRLFLPVDRNIALLGMVFRLISAAIAGTKALFFLMPLVLLHTDPAAWGFTAEQMQGFAVLSLKLHGQAYNISLLFFGVDCLLIGWLIARSGFLPGILGIGLAIAGLCYIISDLIIFLAPAVAATDLFMLFFLPCLVAEAALTLWLIVKGIDAEGWRKASAAA